MDKIKLGHFDVLKERKPSEKLTDEVVDTIIKSFSAKTFEVHTYHKPIVDDSAISTSAERIERNKRDVGFSVFLFGDKDHDRELIW
jgi:hypothetical protein